MNNNPLDLNQLTMDDIDFEGLLPAIQAEHEKIEKECKEKYGDNWWEHYTKIINPDGDNDTSEEFANLAIYYGTEPGLVFDPRTTHDVRIRYEEKMKQFFGLFWKHHIHHKINDPKVNILLIKDAHKTGKWRELPDQLYDKYHKYIEELQQNV